MKVIKRVFIVLIILILLYLTIMFFGVSTTAYISDVRYEYYNSFFLYDYPELYSEEYMRETLRDWFDISEEEIDDVVSNPKEYIWIRCTFEIKNSTPFPIYDLYIAVKNLRKKNEIIPEKGGYLECQKVIKPFETSADAFCFLIKDQHLYRTRELEKILSGCSIFIRQVSYLGIFVSYRPMLKFK